MKNFVLFIFCVLAVLLQLSVAGVFFSARRIPDLALALAVALVVAQGFKKSWKWILLLGVLFDAGAGTSFGMATLALFLVGWIVSGVAKIADIRSKKYFFVVSLAAVAAFSETAKDLLLLAGLKMRANYLQEPLATALNIFSLDYFLKIAYTILATCAVYYIFRRVSRKLFLEPVRLAKKY